MSYIIGIDLGTTSSRVSVFKDGVPVIIENIEGEGTTPSHVAITDSGQRLVGKPARRYAIKDPANAVFAIKRLIGRSFDDPIVQKLIEFMPYQIVRADNGDAWVSLHGKAYSPEEISAYTLQKLKISAEAFLGEAVTEAVITVPADFNESQKQSVRDAATIAGLEVKRIIAEPTAAALQCHSLGLDDRRVAVYDLGGGTFDISIIECTSLDMEFPSIYDELQFEVLATMGDTFLGGEDFDMQLVDYLAVTFQREHGINLLADPIATHRLKEAAESAKIILSSERSTEVDLPFIATDKSGVKHLNCLITRTIFEDLIRGFIDRSIVICHQAIQAAGLSRKDLRQVILVGGSTRIPLAQEVLEYFFGIKPDGKARREDSVALGAAIQAGVLGGEVKDVLLQDVTPFSLGIEYPSGSVATLIAKNTWIPTYASQKFTTHEDDQGTFSIHILQGDQEKAADNLSLGYFELTGITPAPKGVAEIEVSFDIDANGAIDVSAKERGTDNKYNKKSLSIKPKGRLSDAQLKELTAAVQNYTTPNASYRDHDFSGAKPRTASDKVAAKNAASSQRIFISYAHEDSAWAQKIQKSLLMVSIKQGHEIWLDRMINTGEFWEEKIYAEIEKASIAILLLSHDFLGSPFILKNELPRIFAEKERRYLQVFPIMIRSCPYGLHEELAKFQFFNQPEKPLASLQAAEVDEELTRLAYELSNNRR
ncbi:molecular chaperone DnaK [Methylovulum psychrotolerans]|uniref:Chaperone protein DnaK n=1 Tax=Methylovulum psychrotolerans TaxID=1704499 RepID=A0A2S5CNI7_9GAMM|nr:molecular chaperone DnaK [Methylovulum psychrotolerans]POZ52336.1 molecular chaperone DnaK [Methylovulum psychrotolerans]